MQMFIDLSPDVSIDSTLLNELDKPIHSFTCRCCGHTVEIFDTFDKRTVFCSEACEKKYWRDVTRHKDHRRGGNLGMSGAMSLNSLKRLEARSVDDSPIVLIKTCPICGKSFKAISNRQIFCSHFCRRRTLNLTQTPLIKKSPSSQKVIRTFTCKVCGCKVNITDKKDQRHFYCSAKCRKRWKNVLRPQKQAKRK